MQIYNLPTPALVLDLDILNANLKRMQDKANQFKVSLRPHIKTHKCVEIGRRQIRLGAKGIAVSTFFEAEHFAKAGFEDIFWAFPIPFVYISRALELAEQVRLHIVVDSLLAVDILEKACSGWRGALQVWLKIDCGYHRVGVDPESPLAEELIHRLTRSKSLIFGGILTHAGHSYSARNRKEIVPIAEQERRAVVDFAVRMKAKNYPIPAISIGSTPTMSVTDNLAGITEIRPGNYAFYDYTQAMLGTCSVADCALTVMSTVVSHQPAANYFVIDAGALALSKDPGPTHVSNDMGMGVLFEDYTRKRLHAHIHLQILTQEHGKIVADSAKIIDNRFQVGDRLRILEHHACLTAAQFDRYYVVQGEEVIDEWKVLRGRM
ncbi:MAG: D-TA family PLP-dependent enzyme [Ignavibacteria bacterium]|nr:D-TA family PLP-dependent enzyme [Ignavibacteria bacterium]